MSATDLSGDPPVPGANCASAPRAAEAAKAGQPAPPRPPAEPPDRLELRVLELHELARALPRLDDDEGELARDALRAAWDDLDGPRLSLD